MRKPSQVWVAPCMRSSRLSCSGSEEGGGGTSGGTAGRGGGPAAAGRAGVGTGTGARVGAEACGGDGDGGRGQGRIRYRLWDHHRRAPQERRPERGGQCVRATNTIADAQVDGTPGG